MEAMTRGERIDINIVVSVPHYKVQRPRSNLHFLRAIDETSQDGISLCMEETIKKALQKLTDKEGWFKMMHSFKTVKRSLRNAR